jgi:RNA polymerase-binding protein DksA
MDSKEQAVYKSRLFSLRQRLIREIATTEEAIREDVVAPGERAASPTHPADKDAEGFDENVAIAENEEQILEHVEAALERIESGSYGVCQDCRRKISKKRLDAIPYTPWCIDCARTHDGESPPE